MVVQELQALYLEIENMSKALEDTTKKLETQTITLAKWEEERDKLIGSVWTVF